MSLNRSLIHGFLIAVSFLSYLHASRTDGHTTKPAMTDTQSTSFAHTFEERLKAGIEEKRRREEEERATEKANFERRASVRSFRTLQDSYNFTEQPQKEGDASRIMLMVLTKELDTTHRICAFAWNRLDHAAFKAIPTIKFKRDFNLCENSERESLRRAFGAINAPKILQAVRDFNKNLVLLLADHALDIREAGIQIDERGVPVPE